MKKREKINKKYKDKKAWIRIVEAFLACLIILGMVLIVASKQGPAKDFGPEIYEKQKNILNVITQNESLRNSILKHDNIAVEAAIVKLSGKKDHFAINICEINHACPNPGAIYDKDVYVSESIVISNITYYNATKIRYYVW